MSKAGRLTKRYVRVGRSPPGFSIRVLASASYRSYGCDSGPALMLAYSVGREIWTNNDGEKLVDPILIACRSTARTTTPAHLARARRPPAPRDACRR
jgi:hypothetical protein